MESKKAEELLTEAMQRCGSIFGYDILCHARSYLTEPEYSSDWSAVNDWLSLPSRMRDEFIEKWKDRQ